ncbi:Crp/Fnr family transcriptional regulator [Odoribacter laneus]|uniref:Crp/Fnr family transcriptional regulator n=1 Tax=Odoribacter laneus TaxID=626933 RepID=UPI000336506F|nr:Crp/Fnr family transcriptional regulator [Odoribacter laneus]CCZ79940.1 putative uncharacterized protein [Odoribacter laneus CAG:561]
MNTMYRKVIDRIAAQTLALTEKNREKLSACLERFEWAKNDLLLREGQVCKYIWFVDQGMIRLFYNKRGKDLTEHFAYEKGIFLSLESFFRQIPSRLIIEALEPTVVYGLGYEKLHGLMETEPEIEHFYCKILENCLILSQQKADACRFETAGERYHRLLQEHPEVVKRAPLIHIASHLGMSPETLSRVRAGLL